MKKMDTGRQFRLPLAEMIDRLTVNQIKEVLLSKDKESYSREIAQLEHDIDLIIKEKDIKCTARLIRVGIIIGQMNLHIWHHKDMMGIDPSQYGAFLKLAHQLNGVRNRMKNLLLEITGDAEPSTKRSNTEIDGLQGWDVSV